MPSPPAEDRHSSVRPKRVFLASESISIDTSANPSSPKIDEANKRAGIMETFNPSSPVRKVQHNVFDFQE
jgi:hypothetical protein